MASPISKLNEANLALFGFTERLVPYAHPNDIETFNGWRWERVY